MARRLVNILPKFINNTQTGFIKGGYTLENLITNWEAMEWAKTSNQEVAMVLLDFEKAYDRIECAFVRLMEAFGFPDSFCNTVVTLFKDAVAQVDVNGSLSEQFALEGQLGRAVHWPWPYLSLPQMHYTTLGSILAHQR